jgi:ABC-type cobalt transport system substrate-binding protein
MKKILSLLIFILIFFVNIQTIKASLIGNDTNIPNQVESFRQNSGYEPANAEASLGGIIATVIKAFLGFLAIIFIIIIVMAGYKYMTAGGNEDKTREAIDSIRRGIIGLIIIISAYAITYFVFNSMDWFGGGSGGAGVWTY